MLTIRFNRIGKKNKAYFRLVVQEHTIAPGGGHVEILGSYNPHLKKESLKPERIKYWIEKGIKFSDTAFNFLVSKGLLSGPKRKVKLPKKAAVAVSEEKSAEVKIEKKEETSREEAPKEEKPEAEEKKEEAMPATEEKKPEVKVAETAKPEASIDKEKKEA